MLIKIKTKTLLKSPKFSFEQPLKIKILIKSLHFLNVDVMHTHFREDVLENH